MPFCLFFHDLSQILLDRVANEMTSYSKSVKTAADIVFCDISVSYNQLTEMCTTSCENYGRTRIVFIVHTQGSCYLMLLTSSFG